MPLNSDATQLAEVHHSWARSWGVYIRGHVVSRHAQKLITNFLTATGARAAADDESTDEEAEGAVDDDVEALRPTLNDVHQVLSC